MAVRALVADGNDVRDVVAIDALAPAGRVVVAFFDEEVRLLDHDGMVRIVVTPNWAKVIDFEITLPSAVEDLVRQRDERQRLTAAPTSPRIVLSSDALQRGVFGQGPARQGYASA